MEEFDKNKFIFPIFLLVISIAFYVIVHLAPLVKPVTLDDLERQFPPPTFPSILP